MPQNAHRFHIEIPTTPVDLWQKLELLAKKGRRKIKEEALVAIENHLKASGLLSEREIAKMESSRT